MKIAILGSGNVAFHLAKAFKENNLPLVQVFGRNTEDLQQISEETQTPFSILHLEDADLYIIAVSDDSVEAVSSIIKKENCIVAHTSGAVSKNKLNGNYRKAVFYPLQTFSKNKTLNYAEIPFFIEAEGDDFITLENLAKQISTNVSFADSEKRKYIHLSAVFACNFVNHLYAKAKEIADEQNIPFEYLLPLIDETTKKIHELDPKLAQTGPARRNDETVMLLHQQLITNEMSSKIYEVMNLSIKSMYEL